jgi:hypothetical protein
MKPINAHSLPECPINPSLARQMQSGYQGRRQVFGSLGVQMRSDLVFGAIKQVSNRFLLAKGLAKATRAFHRPGTSIEDTIIDVLVRCGSANPIAGENAVRNSTTVGSRLGRQRPVVVHRAGIFTVPPVGESSQAHLDPSRVLVA